MTQIHETLTEFPLISYLTRLPPLVFSSLEFKDLVVENIQDLDTANEYGESPLFITAREGNIQAAVIILEEARGSGMTIDFNRKDRSDVSLLQMVISSQNVELLRVLLQEGEGKIDLNTIFPESQTIYEWMIFLSGLPEYKIIHNIGMMIVFGFAVPNAFPSGETLVQWIVLAAYRLRRLKRSNMFFPDLLKVLDSLRQLAENEGDHKRRLFTEAINQLNVLHLCCITGQAQLLEYFLRSLEEIDPVLLTSMMTVNVHYVPAFICVYPLMHWHGIDPSAPRECLELLVRYGQDINCVLVNSRTLLHWCMICQPDNASQVEISVYLIEQGASVTVCSDFKKTPLDLALWHMKEEFLDTAMRFKAFKPDQLSGTFNSSLIHSLTENVCLINEMTTDITETVETCMRMVQKLIEYGCILDTLSIIQLIRFFTSYPIGRALFPKLLDLGVSYEPTFGQLDAVTVSVIADGLGFCKALLLDGAPLQVENRLVCCAKTPPHRRVTHSDIYGKCDFFNLDVDHQGKLVCDLCSYHIQSKTGHQIATCSDISCNFDFCAGCMFFAGAEEGFTALDMATRKSNPKFINLLNFLQNSTVGKEITERNLVELADLLLNAHIDVEPMLLNLSCEDLKMLGIIDNIGMKRLCSHLVF